MQRYFSKEKIDNKLILNSDDFYHIFKVMRMNESDNIEVVYNEEVYLCEVTSNKEYVLIKEKLEKKENKLQEVILIMPLLKEQKLDYILQKATELGVSKIIPCVMERSVVKLNDEKMDKKIIRWTKICKEASEQSMRVTVPVITDCKYIKDLNDLEGVKLLCSTRENAYNLKKFLNKHENYDRMYIVIGPEGGLSKKEEDVLISYGFEAVTLGSRILRVETVPLFLLSILNFQNME